MDALRIVDAMPEGLAERAPHELAEALGGPTLLRVEGKRNPPLFVSVLLHGNETSGWNGLRELLAKPGPLPRSLIVLIGNVRAAARGVRTLDDQQDYNRIWQGAPGFEGRLAESVLAQLRERPPFAAIDLHNNTGHNPHFAIVADLAPEALGLAYLFSDHAVLVREPDTTLTRAVRDVCPAVTVELGPIGDPRGQARAFDYVERCLALERIPDDAATDLAMYRARARVHIPADVAFAFAGDRASAPLVLTSGVEGVNFHALSAGTEFGATQLPVDRAFRVLDDEHRDVTRDYLEVVDGRVLLKQPVTPSMYTTDPAVIRQDCLCYFMESFKPR